MNTGLRLHGGRTTWFWFGQNNPCSGAFVNVRVTLGQRGPALCIPGVWSWESNSRRTSVRTLSFGSLGFPLILLAIAI